MESKIILTFYRYQDNKVGIEPPYIKQFYWNGVIPVVGDHILLHFGDYNEEEKTYKVIMRVINGLNPYSIDLYLIETQL